ncbi:MaoC/PaaZ C-terminal domain-containing protein [Streptomyces sp. NPDC002758]
MSKLTWTLDAVDAARMKTLALILADPNPIHFDLAAAEQLGTGGRLVNQGPSTIAMIYNLFESECPTMRVKRLDVRLLGNVLEGDRVTVEATPADDNRYDVVVRTASGQMLTAVAELVER